MVFIRRNAVGAIGFFRHDQAIDSGQILPPLSSRRVVLFEDIEMIEAFVGWSKDQLKEYGRQRFARVRP